MATRKGSKAKGKARRYGGGGRGKGKWFGFGDKLGGSTLFEVGAIMTVGAVILGKLCKLPGWLSPVGAALWLWGWWKGNAAIRTLGLLMIGVGFVQLLGIPAAVGQSIDQAQRQGLLGGMFGGMFGGGTTPAPGTVQPQTGRTNFDNLVQEVLAGAGAVTAVRTAFA